MIGSGTISLSPTRGCASYLLEAGDLRMLFDCGPGSAHTMARLHVDWWNLTHIVLSHFHLDHIGDLPTLVFAWRHARLEARTAPLVIVGPPGTRDLLARWAAALGDWLQAPGFPIEVIEPALDVPFALSADVTLTNRSVPHTAESVAYSVEHAGRRFVYTGDTGEDPSLNEWAAGCHLLLAECSLPDSMPLSIHLTPSQVAALATTAAPAMLVVSHMYPPIEGIDLRAELGARWAGPTVIAADGLVLDC
ncbi:MAG TPA: ribonuclease Z [Gemmatimonadaceae bacterium]|nr:ribonuclease Z [Gemmatimonadaceae bacterium]